MTRPGIAINATMLASAIGIDRAVEADVRGVVMRHDRARALDRYLRLERPAFSILLLFLGRPAVVEGLALDGLEAAGDERARAAHEGGFAFAVFGHRSAPVQSGDGNFNPDPV